MTRERPVRNEKIAVLWAIPRPPPPSPGGSGTTGSSPKGSALTDKAAIVRRPIEVSVGPASGPFPRAPFRTSHGQHPLPEEAHPALRARASREPSLHLDDQDVLPQPRVAGRRRRHRRRGHHPPRAGEHDRPD